ncbi:helix-turn-helix domain-containing protein [Microvirga rosea]|uniref:helix-turn-helix domain-containing protein n=1 Tax=Microvirga rosea TaxID=2715425 RepID=UPI001D0A7F6B|nr:helix-turn-helix transcriptional regulator [Microvirga rosea]MCB8821667.1 helix-turn-helix domain-containing protein [Microvirga rosea]
MQKKSPGPIDKHIGNRVRLRRITVGMSQEKLGDALGLTFQQVQKYEKGTNRIGASRLLAIGQILGVGIEFFFEGLPEIGPGGTSGEGLMNEFMLVPESERLVRSFLRLQDGEARRKVADLVDWLASSR